jgi:acyl carrier protein
MKEKVIKLVSEATKIEESKINLNTSFVDDLNLDSLDIVELMMKMEDEFGVEIPEDQAESLKTVQDVVTYLESKSQS